MAKASAVDRVDQMFRAFSDKTRFRILHLLLRGEMCVGDLVTTLRIRQPAVSRHLAYLRRVGLVSTRKRGLWVHYTLLPARSTFHKKLLECLACSCLCDISDIRKDVAMAGKLKKSGGCCPIPDEI
jgi:ArsR family transcriptional regulator